MSKAISAGALPVFIVSLLILVLEKNLISPSPGVIACQALGLAFMLWGRASFPRGSFRFSAAPAGPTIIRTGPYRLVRHPIYTGALLILWASIVGHPSLLNAGIGIVASFAVAAKIVVEERLLRASCPDYPQYARTTKALIPFVL